MKALFILAIACACLGVSCDFPQRTKTFIPATNERDWCANDDHFFYSPEYDFCFRYPSDLWQGVEHTDNRETGITSTTAITFYQVIDTVPTNVFTIYVGPNNASTAEAFTSESILVAHEHPRYLIGYQVDAQAKARFAALTDEIPTMIDGLFFFTADGSRQAEERPL